MYYPSWNHIILRTASYASPKYLKRCKEATWKRWKGEYVKGQCERHSLGEFRETTHTKCGRGCDEQVGGQKSWEIEGRDSCGSNQSARWRCTGSEVARRDFTSRANSAVAIPIGTVL